MHYHKCLTRKLAERDLNIDVNVKEVALEDILRCWI